MSTPEDLSPPGDYSEQLGALSDQLVSKTREIELAEAERKRIAREIADLIKRFGVPEETKFMIAGLGYAPLEPGKRTAYVERLRHVDEQLRAFAGETVAWLTTKKEITSHPFNPAVKPMTEQNYFLNVGLLPQDARLVVDGFGIVTVPVEKSVAIKLIGVNLSSDELSLSDELRPVNTHFVEVGPRLEQNSGISISSYNAALRFPVVFGNKAVENLFDIHDLESHESVTKALETLTSTML